MIRLDDDFLIRLGLGSMPPADRRAFLLHLIDELQLRVGTELSKDLSEKEFLAFEQLIQDDKDDQALQWLKKHCPQYEEVVSAEIETLKQEIIQNRDRLVSGIGS
jgi:hypothetical protein